MAFGMERDEDNIPRNPEEEQSSSPKGGPPGRSWCERPHEASRARRRRGAATRQVRGAGRDDSSHRRRPRLVPEARRVRVMTCLCQDASDLGSRRLRGRGEGGETLLYLGFVKKKRKEPGWREVGVARTRYKAEREFRVHGERRRRWWKWI